MTNQWNVAPSYTPSQDGERSKDPSSEDSFLETLREDVLESRRSDMRPLRGVPVSLFCGELLLAAAVGL